MGRDVTIRDRATGHTAHDRATGHTARDRATGHTARDPATSHTARDDPLVPNDGADARWCECPVVRLPGDLMMFSYVRLSRLPRLCPVMPGYARLCPVVPIDAW